MTMRHQRGVGATRVLLTLAVAASAVAMDAFAVDAVAADVQHLSSNTVAESGRTRVIAFRVAEIADAARTLPVTIENAAALATVGPAVVEAGVDIGYLRVRGGVVGETSLTIGDAELVVRVIEPRTDAYDERFAPRISGPATGAAVWDEIAVGVEVREPPHGPARRIEVRLEDGTVLEPVTDTERRQQPYRQVTFRVNTAPLPAGPLTLLPVAMVGAGDGERREQIGPPVHVQVIQPPGNALAKGEAERRYDVDRPERFRDDRVNVGRDREASGGRYFVNASAQPALCFPLTVETPGLYQVILTARGTRAKGALPTVGIVVDGDNQSRTNGRVPEESWSRFAVGVPFALDSGAHVITPYFGNDFYVPRRADRNLHLDRIEIARVPGATGARDIAAMGASGMAGEGMTAGMTGGGMNGGMAGEGGDTTSMIDDPYADDAAPLRIGFVRPLEDATIPGLIEIEGRCWWDGLERRPAPIVTLFVNERAVADQRSGAPRFWVDPAYFEPGPNRVHLLARHDGGVEARTPTQTLHYPAEAAADRAAGPREHVRFSIHDERWAPSLRDHLRSEHYPKERRSAAFHSNGQATLDLPEQLAGVFHVFLELRGDHHDGPPIAAVTVRQANDETAVGEIEAPTWWDTRRAGTVELAAGPKQLVVEFANDKYDQGVGDRNLWFQSVMLTQRPTTEDLAAPVVDVHYPPNGHRVSLTDAIVAEASDNASLASAELVLDGAHTGMTTSLNLKPGRIVFPLLLRDLEPGEHTVAVRVQDVAGNSSMSEARTITVTSEPPAEAGTYERAVHLLNRFAYGPDPDELAAILTLGESAWLERRLAASADAPGDLAALGAGIPYFVDQNGYTVPRRALSHVLLTPNPVRARFVLWAENHFSTWIRKTDPYRKWQEHVAFTRLGPAPFDHLLFASAESPAMLRYLDQEQSFAGRLNENYAREVMELHTLGVDGGYTQEDVTQLARLLTGWTASFEGDGRGGGPQAAEYRFRFDPRLNDGAATRILGMELAPAAPPDRYDRTRHALELLASHPSTARFVSRKLAEHYVQVPAPDDLVDDLELTFLETGGDMRELMHAIAVHPAFWRSVDTPRIADALDFGARLCRTTRHYQPWQLGDYLQRTGRGLFDRPTPDGYPADDAASSNSNAMIQRWKLARSSEWPLTTLVPDQWRGGAGLPEPEWAQLVTDCIAVSLTGHVLGDASNEAATAFLSGGSRNRHDRVRQVAALIAAMPEANLR